MNDGTKYGLLLDRLDLALLLRDVERRIESLEAEIRAASGAAGTLEKQLRRYRALRDRMRWILSTSS